MREHHGRSKSSAYAVWSGMLARCTNPNCAAYKNYGGRGIAVCARWSKFTGFHADMGDPPPGLSLERIDNNRGYEPGNCRWATRTEQARNKRSLHMLTVNGETLCMGAWAERSGLKITTIWQRIKKGWPPEKAVSLSVIHDRRGKPSGYSWAEPALSKIRLPAGLAPEQIAAIRSAPKGYRTGRVLAQQYGVSEATISAIRHGKRGAWAAQEGLTIKHFDDPGVSPADLPAHEAA